jgi:glycosyltransferase involved in cell wall biosynthesis
MTLLGEQSSSGDGGSGVVLSVVVPICNEEAVIREFHRRTTSVLQELSLSFEIIYVNDGSTDRSLSILQELRTANTGVAILDLSRNFGKEIALTAGLDHARGDAVVLIDADLQHPPEVIPEFLKHWREGYDVVYGARADREQESRLKKFSTSAFHLIMEKVASVRIPRDVGDFLLLSRRAVESLKLFREQHRFMKGLFTWIGYSRKGVPYRCDSRYDGRTKWNYWKLWNFALEGVTSFTIFPLKVASYLGLITAFGAFCYAIYIVYHTLVYSDPVAGYPTLIVVMLFLGGVQLMTLGITGEYIGRIFNETKQRPLYFVNRYCEPRADETLGRDLDVV